MSHPSLLHGPEIEPKLFDVKNSIEAEIEEFNLTVQLMKYHGIQKVRGSIFQEVVLSKEDIRFLNTFMVYIDSTSLLFTRPTHTFLPFYIEDSVFPYDEKTLAFPDIDKSNCFCVYVLTIEYDHLYVGYTRLSNIDKRIQEHKKGKENGASWVKGYKINDVTLFGPFLTEDIARMEELRITLLLMRANDCKFPIVRGGPYVERDLSPETIKNI